MKNPFKRKVTPRSFDINIEDKKPAILAKDKKKYNIGDIIDLNYYKTIYTDIKIIQDKIRKDLADALFYFDKSEYKSAEDACKILVGRKYLTEEEVMKLNNYVNTTAKNDFEQKSSMYNETASIANFKEFKSKMHTNWFNIIAKLILFAVEFFLWSILNGIFTKLIKPVLVFKFLGAKPLNPMAAKLQKIIDNLKPTFDLSGDNANAKKLLNTYTSSMVDNTSNVIENAHILKLSSIILNTIFSQNYIIDEMIRLKNSNPVSKVTANAILFMIGLNKLNDITDEALATDVANYICQQGLDDYKGIPLNEIKKSIVKGDLDNLKTKYNLKNPPGSIRLAVKLKDRLKETVTDFKKMVLKWKRSEEFQCCLFFTLIFAMRIKIGGVGIESTDEYFDKLKDLQKKLKLIVGFLKLRYTKININLFSFSPTDLIKILWNAFINTTMKVQDTVYALVLREIQGGEFGQRISKDKLIQRIWGGRLAAMGLTADTLNCLPAKQLYTIIADTMSDSIKILLDSLKFSEKGNLKILDGIDKDLKGFTKKSTITYSFNLREGEVIDGVPQSNSILIKSLLDLIDLIEYLLEFSANKINVFVQCRKYLTNINADVSKKLFPQGFHRECINGICTLIEGEGLDTCYSDPDCLTSEEDRNSDTAIFMKDKQLYELKFDFPQIEEFSQKYGYKLPTAYKETFKTCFSKYLKEN